MSKLKMTFFAALAVLSLAFSFYSNKNETADPLFNNDTLLWGKGLGPIQVRLILKEQDDNFFTLEGQVKSEFEQFQIEWKLPEGVRLVEGALTENIIQQNPEIIVSRTIKVEVMTPLAKPHLVFWASSNERGETFGHSTVFNLQKTEEEKNKSEKIKLHMKSRNLKKMMK